MTIRVLVAEDSHDLHLLMELAIERDDRLELIGQARNGAEAVALAARERPDVVVLDLDMPEMNGYEALPLIRQGSPNTKVLIWSSRVVPEAAEELGADAYCIKDDNIFAITEQIGKL